MYSHERQALKGLAGPKCDRIREILERNEKVGYQILGEYSTDAEAGKAERFFIALHDGLTNRTAGGEVGNVPVDYKERMRARFQKLLDRMHVSGVKDCSLLRELEKEVRSPSPNMVRYDPDTGVSFHWIKYEAPVHPICRKL